MSEFFTAPIDDPALWLHSEPLYSRQTFILSTDVKP